MKSRIRLSAIPFAFLLILHTAPARAGWTTSNPFVGVTHTQLRGSDAHEILGWTTSPLSVDVMEIQLDAAGIGFTSTPSNGTAEGETDRQTTMNFMTQVDAQIALNTTFFGTIGSAADNVGLVYSNGHLVSTRSSSWPSVNISADNQIELLVANMPNQYPYYNAFAGSDIIVQNGALTGAGQLDHATQYHPRTAFGYNAQENKVILMTVDGRSSISIGVTNDQLGTLMQAFGATWAINLDGGGSTQMTMDAGSPVYVNDPSETYRAVGANLGVFAIPDSTFHAFADFEHGNRATFEYSPGYSGSSEGFNESASTTTLVDVDTPFGASALEVHIVDDTDTSEDWFARIVSGAHAARDENVIRTTSGYVGLWAMTETEGTAISLAIDDPNTGDRGIAQSLIPDGQWHLYEWNLDDDAQWESWIAAGDGRIGGSDFTLDSIQLWGTGNASVWLDYVSHDSDESLQWLLPEPLPGDVDGTGRVDSTDLDVVRANWGQAVPAGTLGDATGDGVVNSADLDVVRANWGRTQAAAVPEPTGWILLMALTAWGLARFSAPCRSHLPDGI